MTDNADGQMLYHTADIVSAFVSNHQMRADELPTLISSVYASLDTVTQAKTVEEPDVVLTPAVSIKKSITDEFLICLEDGKKFKSLKRHLMQAFGLSPEEYRQKWGLPRNYPMVAPGYAAKRSELAKASGLGNSRRKVAEVPAPASAPVVAPKRRTSRVQGAA